MIWPRMACRLLLCTSESRRNIAAFSWVSSLQPSHTVKLTYTDEDLVMPVMDGFAATKRIRTLEDNSWNTFMDSTSACSRIEAPGIPKPIRRAVIVALVPSYSVTGVRQRIADTGFDLSICRPFHQGTLCNTLFSGPGMNVVGLFGGVDESTLHNAGYPLQIRRRMPSSIGEKEVGEVLGRAVV